jgi:hypothetical protein
MTSLQTSTPARLHHLHLCSEDPQTLARFYTDLMDMTPSDLPNGAVLLQGGLRSMQISRGQSCVLNWSGYALRDAAALNSLRAGIKANGARPEDIDAPLFDKGAFVVADPQGRRVVFGVAAAGAKADQRAARTQHVVFQTTELDAMVAF